MTPQRKLSGVVPAVPILALAAVLSVLGPTLVDAADGRGDVSGDGIGDLMAGAPGEDVGGWIDAGVMAEMQGSEYGFNADATNWWTPDLALVDGDAGHDEFFGEPLALGDFNGDGIGDVAIGITGEKYDPGSIYAAGAPSRLAISTATATRTWRTPLPLRTWMAAAAPEPSASSTASPVVSWASPTSTGPSSSSAGPSRTSIRSVIPWPRPRCPPWFFAMSWNGAAPPHGRVGPKSVHIEVVPLDAAS